MDIILGLVTVIATVLVVVWTVSVWRIVATDGAGRRRSPQPSRGHWSSGPDQLPDAPYRSLSRVA